jgi:hypothetical protein
MKKVEKEKQKNNFTKLTHKRGISLIVLIVTIIVIIILAAAVILTIAKNNPIESAKEATFKEDVRAFQDDLALTVAKEYTDKQGQRDEKISTSDFKQIKEYIPSFTEKYKGKFIIEKDELKYAGEDEKEIKLCEDLNISKPQKWDDTAAPEDCFYWYETDPESGNQSYTGIKRYNTIFAYKEGLKGMTTLRIPSRCIAIYYPNTDGKSGSEYLANVKNIELPNTLKVIGVNAFYRCINLTNITIPNSVISIDKWAFESCVSLEKITIPNSVTWIGSAAFMWCSSLTNIDFQGTMVEWNNIDKDDTWAGSSSLKTITCTDGTITL